MQWDVMWGEKKVLDLIEVTILSKCTAEKQKREESEWCKTVCFEEIDKDAAKKILSCKSRKLLKYWYFLGMQNHGSSENLGTFQYFMLLVVCISCMCMV